MPIPSTLLATRTDPWMRLGASVDWAGLWGSRLVDLGDAGHVNVDSGHGPWPFGRRLVERHVQKLNRRERMRREQPPAPRIAA